MDWIRHFPTLHPLWRRTAEWYLRRDTLEKAVINFVAWAGVIYIIFMTNFAAPIGFPSGAYIRIDKGATLTAVAQTLEERRIVDSAFKFKVVTKILGDDRHIVAGEYYFSRQENMFWVALRVLNGDFETVPVRVTVPEGATVNDISMILLQKVPEFNRREFVERAKEGYMFPDTYFFRPGQSTEAILSVFENNFRVKMLKVQKEILASGHTQEEIIIMASLLEKEAADTQSRRMIAGILWHRIEIGMPLQVDAVFPYIIGKNSFTLTLEDLKIDSPYNTYKYKGLPIGPIANPGLDSILAAATPVKTKYVFYLSDMNGKFHYATTYAQHLVNKKKYLGS